MDGQMVRMLQSLDRRLARAEVQDRGPSTLSELYYPGAPGTASTVSTTFNANGSITEVFTTLGVTRTTSFSGSTITEAYTGNLTRTRTTTLGSGTMTETVT